MLQQKVLIVTNIPNPYRIPLFNELNRQGRQKNILLKVVFGALSYKRRKFELDMSDCEFDYEFLDSFKFSLGSHEKTFFTYNGLAKVIEKEKPDKIIVSGYSLATIKLWFRSLLKPTKYIIWSGSINNKGRKDSWLRKRIRKILVKRASSFIAYGTLAKKYLADLGAAESRIHIGINTTDVFYYLNTVSELRKRDAGRKIHQLLVISYLTKGKRIDRLLLLAKELTQIRKDFELVIVGSGKEENNLKTMAEKLGITDFVKFEGFRQKHELPAYLAKADCFLFSTDYDIWGISLVEAMAGGLVCFSSVHAGATHDLIKEGENGFAVDFERTNLVADKINFILNNPEIAKKTGESAREFMTKNITAEKSANGFIKAILEA